MKGVDRPIIELIKAMSQFVIPVFQRDYSWKAEEHCAQLWRDVLRASSPDIENHHFLGTIVGIPAEDTAIGFNRCLLVDGQQRLTTLMLLLIAMRDHIRKSNAATVDGRLPEQIDAYLKNPLAAGDQRYRLLLRGRDRDAFRQLVDGNRPIPGLSPAIEAAYSYFTCVLDKADVNAAWRGIHRLVIVEVTLARGLDDPQRIFESLNATGLALGKADLIRNFILMGLEERAQTAMYEKYWRTIERLFRDHEPVFDDFARDYLDLKTEREAPTRGGSIYPDFREFWRRAIEGAGLEPALADMVRHAHHYAAFRIGPDSNSVREERYDCIRRLSAAPAIVVMQLLECRESVGGLGDPDLMEALRIIESFLVRRSVCGWTTQSYGKVFATVAARVRSVSPSSLNPASGAGAVATAVAPTSPLDAMKAALRLRPIGYEFPTDHEFGQALRERNLYHQRICKFLLDRLQNHDNKQRVDTAKYTIEHILPQNPRLRPEWTKALGPDWETVQDTWVHRLGNLTLTRYNPEFSDRPFQEKKTMPGGFLENPLGRINRFVTEQEAWNAETIERRTKQLAKRALTVWPRLQVAESSIHWAVLRQRMEASKGHSLKEVQFDDTARRIFESLRMEVLDLGPGVVEIPEQKSVTYHGPRYFLEVLPRKGSLVLLLPLPFDDTGDPKGVTTDLREKAFIAGARCKNESETLYRVLSNDTETIRAAMYFVERAYRATSVEAPRPAED